MAFERLRSRAPDAVRACPKVLDENASVRATVDELGTLDTFVRTVRLLFKDSVLRSPEAVASGNREILRVRVACPERLLEVGEVLLVEGPAGCGKTTLLKVLGIRLAELGRKVAYLQCAELMRESRTLQLKEIVRKFAKWSEAGAARSRKTVLIVDGLDEASFDLSEHIRRGRGRFAHIIVSCRNAFPTDLREES